MRKPLTREAILDAAIELLDRDGMAGLSMRKLGAAVGVEAMSLYNHVPNKDALLDGIHERILLSLEAPAHTRSWQAFVRHQALALHGALQSHPNAIPLFATRPAATAASMDRLERYLEVLSRAGFKPIDALSIVQLVAQLVVGHAMWTTSVDVVLLDDDAPPHVKQASRALTKWNPDRELELGIDALIHGFERLPHK
jgi:AcrR family transcriptional regulator